jgi:hypothetical protein
MVWRVVSYILYETTAGKLLTAFQARIHIWYHSPDTLLVFDHKSANFRTYFKNKSVLDTCGVVLKEHNFDRGRRSSSPVQDEINFQLLKQGDVIKRISDQVLDGGRGSGPDFWIIAVP